MTPQTGFPGSFDRAQFFEQEVFVPLCILLLKCPNDVLRQRLHSRAETGGHSDDNDQAIDRRIAVLHHDNTKQVLNYYAQRRKLVHVDASMSQLDVLANVELGLGQYLRLVPSGSADPERSETVTRKWKRTASE
jgi:adenylate kinase family enzyme